MTAAPFPSLQPLATVRTTESAASGVRAHFGPLREPLLNFITGSTVLVGCVAWITQRDILAALGSRPVALVVQKEDFWKKADSRGEALRRRYEALRGGISASVIPAGLRSPLDPAIGRNPLQAFPAISCVGYQGHGHSAPLMHHKFIVRCEPVLDETGTEILLPIAVWTGSFNFSAAANSSLENAVEIHDPEVAAAYLAEFAVVVALAEPMAWRFRKPKPGTALNPAPGSNADAVIIPVKPRKTTSNVVTSRRPAKRRAPTPAKKQPDARSTSPRIVASTNK